MHSSTGHKWLVLLGNDVLMCSHVIKQTYHFRGVLVTIAYKHPKIHNDKLHWSLDDLAKFYDSIAKPSSSMKLGKEFDSIPHTTTHCVALNQPLTMCEGIFAGVQTVGVVWGVHSQTELSKTQLPKQVIQITKLYKHIH